MHGTHRRWLLAAFASLSLLLSMSACGSSSSSSGGGSSTGASASSTTAASGTKKVSAKKIGWVDATLAGSFQQRVYQAGKAAIEHVGWKVQTVDTKGDPAAAASGVSSLVQSGVDAIIMSAVTPATARAGLLQAKARGIPVLMVGSGVDDSLDSSLDLTYIGEDENQLAKPLGDLMVKNLRKGDSVGVLTTTALASAVTRTKALTAQLQAAGIKVIRPLETGFDFSAGQRNASTLISQNPGMTAIVPIFDLWTAASVSAIKAQHSSAKVYSFYADAVSTPLMRKNPNIILGLTDSSAITSAYVAVDKLLAHFTSNAKIDASGGTSYTYGAVTRDNLPPGSQNGPVSQTDAQAPFYARWAREYGIGAS